MTKIFIFPNQSAINLEHVWSVSAVLRRQEDVQDSPRGVFHVWVTRQGEDALYDFVLSEFESPEEEANAKALAQRTHSKLLIQWELVCQ